MADHMTAGQLRAELSALNEFLGVVSGYAKIDDERVRLARGRMTSLAARLSGMAVVPEGWKLVPVVPTDEMLDVGAYAGEDHHNHRNCPSIGWGHAKAVYDAMIADAPGVAKQSGGVQHFPGGDIGVGSHQDTERYAAENPPAAPEPPHV